MDVKSLEGILLNIHATLAAIARTPEIGLTEAEAGALAQALAQVSSHYELPSIAPAVIDHVNLVMVLLAVYAPRIAAVRARTMKKPPPDEERGAILTWPQS